MSPKAVRGGAGRGRGRGIGKATASDPAAADSPAPDVQMTDALASQSETAPTSEVPALAPAVSTPQLSEAGDNSFSPNSSPATIPTETPAPTPAHSGPGASSGAATSQTASDAFSTSKAGPSTRGGRGGAKVPSKFKPKANRADATKLAELARKEEARLAGIAATKAREEARALRGRGRPARGRGDAMGRSSRGGGGSGLFGALPESIKNSSIGFTRLGGGGGSGVSGIKTELGPSRSGGYTGGGGGGGGGGGMGGFNKDYVPEPHYPGEDGDAPRVDIAMINLVPGEEDDEIQYIGTKSIRKTGMRPVRLDRHEHKARATIVNTGPVIKIEDDEDGVEVDETRSSSRPGPVDSRIGDLGDEIKIKTEPGLAPTFRHISPDSTSTVEPLSPESKRKVKQIVADLPELKMDDDAIMTGVLGEKKVLPKKKRAHKQVIQTEEDKAEYERHLEDVAILASELGGLQGNLTDKSKGTHGQEDVLMEEAAPKPEDKRSGRLYLFQFPPVLPELYDPVKGKPVDSKKMHDLSVDGNGDVEVSSTGISAKSKAKAKDRADITRDSVAIKMEEEPTSLDKAKMEEEKKSKGKRTPYVHEEGWIGKLVVRQSGKVELSWGGVNLLVGRGVDAGFLTTGIVVDSLEKGPVGGGAPEGRAMSMGQIMGKFVVTPDMENLV